MFSSGHVLLKMRLKFSLINSIPPCHLQEENRILEKTNRQKVLEVEKLSQTIQELEEAILAGGAAANAIRDYKRQIEELHVCLMPDGYI